MQRVKRRLFLAGLATGLAEPDPGRRLPAQPGGPGRGGPPGDAGRTAPRHPGAPPGGPPGACAAAMPPDEVPGAGAGTDCCHQPGDPVEGVAGGGSSQTSGDDERLSRADATLVLTAIRPRDCNPAPGRWGPQATAEAPRAPA